MPSLAASPSMMTIGALSVAISIMIALGGRNGKQMFAVLEPQRLVRIDMARMN